MVRIGGMAQPFDGKKSVVVLIFESHRIAFIAIGNEKPGVCRSGPEDYPQMNCACGDYPPPKRLRKRPPGVGAVVPVGVEPAVTAGD